jgi:hypothetical protein
MEGRVAVVDWSWGEWIWWLNLVATGAKGGRSDGMKARACDD